MTFNEFIAIDRSICTVFMQYVYVVLSPVYMYVYIVYMYMHVHDLYVYMYMHSVCITNVDFIVISKCTSCYSCEQHINDTATFEMLDPSKSYCIIIIETSIHDNTVMQPLAIGNECADSVSTSCHFMLKIFSLHPYTCMIACVISCSQPNMYEL